MATQIEQLALFLFSASIVACFNPSHGGNVDDASDEASTDANGPTGGTSSTTGPSVTTTDPDSTTTSPTTSPTGADSTDGPNDECGNDMECVPAVSGWAGPFLRTAAGGCTAPFPSHHLTLGTEVNAPAAECECSCGNPTGLSCVSQVKAHQTAAVPGVCLGNPTSSANAVNGTCESSIDGFSSQDWVAELPQISGGNCTATPVPTIQPPSFDDAFDLCEAPDASNCGSGGSCLPSAEVGTNLCIVVEGEHDCPDGSDYADRHLVYSDIDDDRGCGDCSCTPSGSCTGWTARLYTTHTCTGTPYNLPPDGACRTFASGGNITAVRLESGSIVNQSCQPGPSNPSGGAEATGAYTVCCMAD